METTPGRGFKPGYKPIELGYTWDPVEKCYIAFIASGGPAHSEYAAKQELAAQQANSAGINGNSNTGNSVTNNSVTNNVTNIKTGANITINMFGKENMDHITPLTILGILSELGSVSDADMPKAINKILQHVAQETYNNHKFPSNSTVFMPAAKAESTIAMGDGSWIAVPTETTLSRMTNTCLDQLFDKQPSPGAYGVSYHQNFENISPILRYAAKNEAQIKLNPPECLRSILVANKSLLKQVLGKVPKVGDKCPATASN